MQNSENQIPLTDSEDSSSKQETVTLSKEQFETLTSKVDAFSKQLDAYQKAQKQLNNIVQDAVAPQVQPTVSWIEKAIMDCNFNSDVNVDANSLFLDPTISGKQYATWYFSDLVEQGKSLDEIKKSALEVMSVTTKVI